MPQPTITIQIGTEKHEIPARVFAYMLKASLMFAAASNTTTFRPELLERFRAMEIQLHLMQAQTRELTNNPKEQV